MIDARAWLLWAGAGSAVAISTRNPIYLLLILLIATVVDRATAHLRRRQLPFRPQPLVAFAVVAGALLNALLARVGETELFELPPVGAVTLEAAAWGATSGLALGTIYAFFFTFNQVTAVPDLVRLAPRAFRELGIVVTIALTFVPEATRAYERVREAQAVRGHRLRGARDLIPLAVPLVVGGLERSMGLAEAMVARGYGATASQRLPFRTQALLTLGLAGLLGGWLAYLSAPDGPMRTVALLGLGAGAAATTLAISAAGRAAPRSNYRLVQWRPRDSVVAAGSLLAGSAVAFLPLSYSPYPRLILPDVDPLVALTALGLLAPALVAGRR